MPPGIVSPGTISAPIRGQPSTIRRRSSSGSTDPSAAGCNDVSAATLIPEAVEPSQHGLAETGVGVEFEVGRRRFVSPERGHRPCRSVRARTSSARAPTACPSSDCDTCECRYFRASAPSTTTTSRARRAANRRSAGSSIPTVWRDTLDIGWSELDELVQRTVDAVTVIARKATPFATKLLLGCLDRVRRRIPARRGRPVGWHPAGLDRARDRVRIDRDRRCVARSLAGRFGEAPCARTGDRGPLVDQ